MDSSSSTTKGDARLIKLTVGEAQSIMRAFNRVVDQRGNVDVDVFQRQNKKVKALLQSKVDAIDDLDKRKEDKIEAMTFSNDDSGIDLGEDTGGSQSPGITDPVIPTARKVVKISAPVSKDDRHVDGAKADATPRAPVITAPAVHPRDKVGAPLKLKGTSKTKTTPKATPKATPKSAPKITTKSAPKTGSKAASKTKDDAVSDHYDYDRIQNGKKEQLDRIKEEAHELVEKEAPLWTFANTSSLSKYPPGDSRNIIPPVAGRPGFYYNPYEDPKDYRYGQPIPKKDTAAVARAKKLAGKAIDEPIEKPVTKPVRKAAIVVSNDFLTQMKCKDGTMPDIETKTAGKLTLKFNNKQEERVPVANMLPKPVVLDNTNKPEAGKGDGKAQTEKGDTSSAPAKKAPEMLVTGTERKPVELERNFDVVPVAWKVNTFSSLLADVSSSPVTKQPEDPQKTADKVTGGQSEEALKKVDDTTTTTVEKDGSSKAGLDVASDGKSPKAKKSSGSTSKKSKRTADEARLDSGETPINIGHVSKYARSDESSTSRITKSDKKSASPPIDGPQAKTSSARPIKEARTTKVGGRLNLPKGVAQPKGRPLSKSEVAALEKRHWRRQSHSEESNSDDSKDVSKDVGKSVTKVVDDKDAGKTGDDKIDEKAGKQDPGKTIVTTDAQVPAAVDNDDDSLFGGSPPASPPSPSTKRKRGDDEVDGEVDDDGRPAKKEKL